MKEQKAKNNFKEELRSIADLVMVESKGKDREPIDFSIKDKRGEFYANVYGTAPDDVEVECEHDLVEYDDDETVGECILCGATCYWHKEDDGEGHLCRVPHEWIDPDKPGGAIGKYLKELLEEW